MADSVLSNEWFPVASQAGTTPGSMRPFELLDQRFVLICDEDGSMLVTADTCPHRGAQLSLGSFDGRQLQCGYHGWEFSIDGRCVHQPAHPGRTPPEPARLAPISVQQRYGLWWVCIGDSPAAPPEFAAYDDEGPALIIDPTQVESSGPRIVENFLDLAHFPFVHEGYLGQVPHTAVERYSISVDDGVLTLSDCSVWQPNPGPKATRGGPVRYQYTVSHPYAATLTKVPSEHDGGALGGFSILLIASPLTETSCLVWRVVKTTDPNVDTDAQLAFNRTIFEQDIPIVESQLPKLLPIDPKLEQHQPADAGSLAYRKWLRERGISYGTTTSPSIHLQQNGTAQ